MNEIAPTLGDASREVRYVHELEKLTVFAVELLLKDAKVDIPAGRDDIGIYLGIDDSIEDIKDEFFTNILKDGMLGTSPLLFPFTSPNSLTAQASIVFDIRGESILMPLEGKGGQAVEYADECVSGNYTKMAVAGSIKKLNSGTDNELTEYEARLYFLERPESAETRGARVYSTVPEVFA